MTDSIPKQHIGFEVTEEEKKFFVVMLSKDEKITLLKEKVEVMLRALKNVEWVYLSPSTAMFCPWCGRLKREKHAKDCQRQRAIAKGEKSYDFKHAS